MELIGVLLGVVALILIFVVERLRRPSLSIEPVVWMPSFPTTWTFAAVRIHNRPLRRPLGWFLSRNIAQGCAVTVSFENWGTGDRALPPVQARWSGNPQPLRQLAPQMSVEAALTQVTRLWQYDATLDPPRRDIPVSPDGEEVAVAILLAPDKDDAGGAYAWGTESYNYSRWKKPEWKLRHGTYEVRIAVSGSDVQRERRFKLEYLDEDFTRFRMQRL